MRFISAPKSIRMVRQGEKMRRIVFAVTMAAALMFLFADVDLQAQSQRKSAVPKPGSGKSQIVIEYVSFPDQYKKYEVYPWETLTLDDFQKSYGAMIQEGKFEDWVKSLSGTAAGKNRMIRVFREQFVLIVCCKPHLCDASQIIVLYDPVKKRVFSILAADGKFYWFGQPPPHMRDLLNVLLVEEYKAIYRGQS